MPHIRQCVIMLHSSASSRGTVAEVSGKISKWWNDLPRPTQTNRGQRRDYSSRIPKTHCYLLGHSSLQSGKANVRINHVNKTVKQNESELGDQATVVWSIRRTRSPSRAPFSLLRITKSKSPSVGRGVDWSSCQAQLTNCFPGETYTPVLGNQTPSVHL